MYHKKVVNKLVNNDNSFYGVYSKLSRKRFSDLIKRNIKQKERLMLITGTKTITKEEWKLVEIALEKIRTIEIEKKRN